MSPRDSYSSTVYNAYNTRVRRILFLSILLFPFFSLAAVQAGFPSQAIWASKSSAVEGETVVVSAVVHNGGAETLRGTLVLTAEEMRIGAREFELPSGESQIHSIEWKPEAGEYKLAAKIEGTSAELSQRETPSITVSITEPPPPSVVEETVSQLVQSASTLASSSAPIITQAAQALFAQTEALREAGIVRLENYLAANAVRTPSSNVQGFVAGTSTSAEPGTKNLTGMFSGLTQTAAAAALFTMKNVMLFYPLLILLVFGTLYYLARRVRRV